MTTIWMPRAGCSAWMTAFKKRRSGRLLWIGANYPDGTPESKIRDDAYNYVAKHHANKGYNLYGGPMKEKPIS